MTPLDPPRPFTRLLLASLPAAACDEITGDLHEEFVSRAARRGPAAARAWYVLQASRLALGFTLARLLPRQPDPHAPNPGDSLMRTVLTETRHALRTLWKRPALSAIVVVTLAVGLAANAAIFQVIDALVLRPFTFADVDRLVMVAETAPDARFDTQETLSPANFLDLRAQADTIDELAAVEWWDVNVASEEGAERVSGFYVSANFFNVMGVQPAIGRGFTVDEETPGAHRRLVLGHAFWSRRFASDRTIVGRTLLIDAVPYEVVGIMPEGFEFPMGAEMWGPLAMDAKTRARRDSRYLTSIGRLAPGRSLADAQAQVTAIGQRLAQQYPEANKGRGARAMTVAEGMRDQGLGPIAGLWQASAVIVLLIACANIANLLLARGTERQREIAVRTALGASRGRITRELLIESVVLALVSVPAALGLAWIAIQLIRANLPARLVRFVAGWQTLDVDARLVVFTFALAIITSVLFGLLPSLRSSRPVLTDSLKEGGRGSTVGPHRQRLRRALVVVQIAIALPLLVASAVSTISANHFLNGRLGYDPDGVLSLRAALPDTKYEDPVARRRFVEETLRTIAALPGVRSVTVSNSLPSTSNNPSRAIEIEGKPNPDPANPPTAEYRLVSPSYFDTLRVPVLRGRGFTTADDQPDAQPVVVVSSSFAEKFFPGQDPLGRRLRFGTGDWQTVVGVSGDVVHHWFASRNEPAVYRPYALGPAAYLAFAVRTDGDPSALVLPVQAAIHAVDPAQAAYEVMSMRTALYERTIGLQYVAAIMAVLGGIAIVLAVIGVYSVMAFTVAQRTHEIGVRIALGASQGDVLRLTIGNAVRLAAVGVALGLIASVAMGRALEAALFGVLAMDYRIALAGAIVLISASVLAGYIPARRATGIDPMTAMRD